MHKRMINNLQSHGLPCFTIVIQSSRTTKTIYDYLHAAIFTVCVCVRVKSASVFFFLSFSFPLLTLDYKPRLSSV